MPSQQTESKLAKFFKELKADSQEALNGIGYQLTMIAEDFLDTFKPYEHKDSEDEAAAQKKYDSYYFNTTVSEYADERERANERAQFVRGLYDFSAGLILFFLSLAVTYSAIKKVDKNEQASLKITRYIIRQIFVFWPYATILAVRGATQVVTAPLVLLLKMPLRWLLTKISESDLWQDRLKFPAYRIIAPFKEMVSDLKATFTPYSKSPFYADKEKINELLQGWRGLKNVAQGLTGLFMAFANLLRNSIMGFKRFPGTYMSLDDERSSTILEGFKELGIQLFLKLPLEVLGAAALLVRGVTQFVTAPFVLLLKMPLRWALTKLVKWKKSADTEQAEKQDRQRDGREYNIYAPRPGYIPPIPPGGYQMVDATAPFVSGYQAQKDAVKESEAETTHLPATSSKKTSTNWFSCNMM